MVKRASIPPFFSKFTNARAPQSYPVPYKWMMPLQLKDRVSGKYDKDSSVACLQELTNLFACMKKSEFDQSKCPAEIELVQKCWTSYHAEKRAKEAEQKKEMYSIPYGKDLSWEDINKLFKKYPQPK